MEKVIEIFGSNVFGDTVMKKRLPKDVYDTLKSTIKEGKGIDSSIADTVANAMKEWAIEKGATHFTHWLQPQRVSPPKSTTVLFLPPRTAEF